MTVARLARAASAALVLLVTALLAVAGAPAPAARAADGGFTVTTKETVRVGTRPTIEVSADEAGSGRLRISVLSTFGKGKGLPKDKRAWQTRVAYDGKPVTVEGPVLRVGDYRIKVWFVADGSGATGESAAPQASTTFSVLTADGGRDVQATSKGTSDGAAAEHDDRGGSGGSGGVVWTLLALVLLAGAAGVAVLLLRGRRRTRPATDATATGTAATAPAGRRRADVPLDPDPESGPEH